MSRPDVDALSNAAVAEAEARALAYRHARAWALAHAPVPSDLLENVAWEYAIWYEAQYMSDPRFYGNRSHEDSFREFQA